MLAAVTLAVFTAFLPAAYAGWVVGPETGWSRERYVPKPNAREQYDHALEFYKSGEYGKAAVAFAMMGRFYPESRFAEESEFMRAECLFQAGRIMTALMKFEEFIKAHPNSERRSDVVDREIDIGERLLGGARKDVAGGVRLFKDRERGVEVIEDAIKHDPYHKRAPASLMLVADTRFEGGWYSDAKDVYTRVAEEYPKSILRPEAEYMAVLADSKRVEDVTYDTSACERIEKKCRRLEAKNKGEMAKKAAELAETLRGRRAAKELKIAEFYRRTGRRKAALTYYRLIVKSFEGTKSAEKAEKCLERLSGK